MTTNGHVNGANGAASHTDPHALNVAIIGAGIGGLMAAIGLCKQGHKVNLYEQSQFAEELGAAIHLAPNANGLLRRWGINPDEFGAVNMQYMSEWTSTGEPRRTVDLTEPNKLWQHPWQLSHRVRLHNKLKETALKQGAKLNLGCKVLAVDAAKGTVKLEDGSEVHADIIVGADGIYSKTRASLDCEQPKLFPSGKAAFRFLIPRKDVEADPLTATLVEKKNELVMWYAQDRRLVMYPCNDNELLNFVCIHPQEESQGSTEEWNKQASLDQLLKVYKDFSPEILALLSKAPPETVKVWKLLDMEILPTWINGKLALLGDAAHPFLPHQGQGAGVAMEDAVALSGVLPLGTTPADIPERLKLYEKIRYTRANAIQEFSRLAGKDWIGGKPQVDMMKYTVYNFGHDEYDNTTKIFNEHIRSKHDGLYRRMPIAFGPAVGPRQNYFGGVQRTGTETFRTASIKIKTSRTFLQNLFPTEKFTFTSPGTVAYASFSVTTLDNMRWLGGGGYHHFGLYIHGVTYTKQDGSVINGSYLPILFESLADPIITGRDEIGMPKIWCEIDVHPRTNSYRMSCSWRGAEFVNMSLENLVESDPGASKGTFGGEDDYGLLVYKYSPAVGRPGVADCEYPIILPYGEDGAKVPSKVSKVRMSDKAQIRFDRGDWESLPTIHSFASVLADIPIYEVVQAKVVHGMGVPDVSSARRVE